MSNGSGVGNGNDVYYFAYGSNMSEARIKEKGAVYSERKPAKLRGYRFAFNKQWVEFPTLCNANMNLGEEIDIIFGGLYLCTKESLAAMDTFENVKGNDSARQTVTVELENGEKIEAIAYAAHPRCVKEGLKISRQYIDYILDGKDLLPESYFAFLKSFESRVV